MDIESVTVVGPSFLVLDHQLEPLQEPHSSIEKNRKWLPCLIDR